MARRQIDYLAARSMLKFVSDTVTNLRNLTFLPLRTPTPRYARKVVVLLFFPRSLSDGRRLGSGDDEDDHLI